MSAILAPGHKVLLLHAYYTTKEHLSEVVESLQKAVEDSKLVAVENIETLVISDHASSSFDVVFCGALTPTTTFHPAEVFDEIARILKPGGTVIIRESVSIHDNVPSLRTASELASALKLSGFINVSQPTSLPVTKTNVKEYEKYFQHNSDDISLVEIRANKPSFEVGSFVTPEKAASKVDPNTVKIWMPSLDENVKFINEDDLKKPDPSTLRAASKVYPNAAKIWMPSTDDILDENVKFINEDELKKPDPSTLRDPVYIAIMRNSRGKFFVCVAVLAVLCLISFLLSSTHSSLTELEHMNEKYQELQSVNGKCQQERDSFYNMLQAVYERKNRLEESLQQEKIDHRETKKEKEEQLYQLENELEQEKNKTQKLETQITQLKTNYSNLEEEKAQSENELSEKLKNIQVQKDKEIEKLQNHITELLAEKDKLEMANNAQMWKGEQQGVDEKALASNNADGLFVSSTFTSVFFFAIAIILFQIRL